MEKSSISSSSSSSPVENPNVLFSSDTYLQDLQFPLDFFVMLEGLPHLHPLAEIPLPGATLQKLMLYLGKLKSELLIAGFYLRKSEVRSRLTNSSSARPFPTRTSIPNSPPIL